MEDDSALSRIEVDTPLRPLCMKLLIPLVLNLCLFDVLLALECVAVVAFPPPPLLLTRYSRVFL